MTFSTALPVAPAVVSKVKQALIVIKPAGTRPANGVTPTFETGVIRLDAPVNALIETVPVDTIQTRINSVIVA